MRHAVWVILKDRSILEGWLPSQAKRVLHARSLREGDSFKMVIDKKHRIQDDTLLAVRDILVEPDWRSLTFCLN